MNSFLSDYSVRLIHLIMSNAEQAVLNYLKTVLKNIKYDNHEMKINAVSSDGANYTSALYNITVKNPGKETLELFAKIANISDTLRADLNAEVLYENEKRVYSKIAVAFNEMQDKYGVPDEHRFVFTKYYGSSLVNGKEVFILENLNAKGYKIIDRFEPTKRDNTFDVISNLAKFHALGFALEKEYPDMFKEYEDLSPLIMKVYDSVDFSAINIDKCVPNMDADHKNRVKKYFEGKNLEDFKKFYYCVGRKMLIHGDYRGSNILYKETTDGRWSLIPVDYQTVRHGCGVTDLLYFITCGTDEKGRQNFHQMVDHYYSELAQALNRLRINIDDVYPRKQYDLEFNEMLPLTLLLVMFMMPMMLVPSEAAPAMNAENSQFKDFIVAPTDAAIARIEGYVRDCARWGII